MSPMTVLESYSEVIAIWCSNSPRPFSSQVVLALRSGSGPLCPAGIEEVPMVMRSWYFGIWNLRICVPNTDFLHEVRIYLVVG